MAQGHTPRQLSRPGLSLVDANQGRLITYQEDVLGYKRLIEETWPGRVSCFFDDWDEKWVIVEHCADGTDSVMFTTVALNQGTIDRIHKADQASRSYVDFEERLQKEEAEIERAKDQSMTEALGEVGEKLYHAMRKDGILHKPQVFFSS